MKKKYLEFPEDVKYIAPLIRDNISVLYATQNDTVKTECTLKNTGDGFVTLSAPGFHSAMFVDKHFEFLLFCGEITKVS